MCLRALFVICREELFDVGFVCLRCLCGLFVIQCECACVFVSCVLFVCFVIVLFECACACCLGCIV